MYAVIFRARLARADEHYSRLADQLRVKAQAYGCLDFVSVCERGRELAISYWPDEASIAAWKRDELHREAQQKGRDEWYQNYRVEVVKVVRSYEA